MHHQNQTNIHIPVLMDAVLQYLDPQEGDSYLDLTAGYGGHASAILERTNCPERAVLIDRDAQAVEVLTQKFIRAGTKIIHWNFLDASRELAATGYTFDMILADLGVSSLHLNEAARGFAIAAEAPLDMRMDQAQQLTAADIVNQYSVEDLEEILSEYGEEPKAKRIARLIVQSRPITTTKELAHIAVRAWPGHSKTHPATRTFQAIRIAVNDELGLLEKSLPIWVDLLKPGGKIAVISFHSLEDRLVKRAFADVSGNRYDSTLQILTKHPIAANSTEIVFNPRARSAKLRAAAKINK